MRELSRVAFATSPTSLFAQQLSHRVSSQVPPGPVATDSGPGASTYSGDLDPAHPQDLGGIIVKMRTGRLLLIGPR